MKPLLLFRAALLLTTSACGLAPARAQGVYSVPVGMFVSAIAAQNAANREIAAKTTTTATYRGQDFLLKRTPATVLTGAATDRIEQVEAQLTLCHTALLADSTGLICPPERQTIIRETIKYIDLARPNWSQKAYRQEFKLYLAEDARRRKAAKETK